jgi:hypothetical protein
MTLHRRPQYRWDGRKIHPDALRETEAELNRLLRLARARTAAAHGLARPYLDESPMAGDAFVWRPHAAKSQNAPDHGNCAPASRRTMQPIKVRGSWMSWALLWLILIATPVVAGTFFGADVVSFARYELDVGPVDIAERIRARLGD